MPEGCVATIGVFDGVHLGHRQILERTRDEAIRVGLPSLVFSFEPTPQEAMNPGAPPARLMNLREKCLVLEEAGIDHLYCPPFESRLKDLTPEAFVEQLLVGTLGVRHLIVGDDFRFGRGRSGSFAHLEAGGRRHGFGVERVGSVTVHGLRVSSTAIRAALAAGDMQTARLLLGRPYRMAGKVSRGRQLGRQLGFPTANLRLNRRVSPVHGIFAVRVHGIGRLPRDAVASVGTRPTVAGVEPLLEVYVFDFEGDLYDRRICVDFVARLRDEVRFDDLGAMQRQMVADAEEARRLLVADTSTEYQSTRTSE